MNFLYPVGFAAFISVAAIILMYMLKQKQTEQPFSSIMLWEKAVLRTLAQKPWQKLRKNLLMFLQILAAIFLMFALAGPGIAGDNTAKSYVIVLDASYSMQTDENNVNRFDAAKSGIRSLVNNAADGSVFSLVVAADEPGLAVNFTDNKKLFIEKLEEVNVSNGNVNFQALESIVSAMAEQQGSEICIFSDKGFGFEGLNAVDYVVGENKNNLTLTSMSHSVDADKIVVMTKVHNYGQSVEKNSVALYTDGKLHDMKSFEIGPDEDFNVFFTNVPYGSIEITAELTNTDDLEIDNYFYDVVEYEKVQQAILFSEANIFLENALDLLPSIELYKGDIQNINNVSGYYLYIYDGVLPDVLPEDGHVIIFNPDESSALVQTGNEVTIDSLIVNNRSFLNYIENFDFSIYKSKMFTVSGGDDVILSSNGFPIAYSNENNGIKTAVFGFDLHNTDLPLRKEFPVFMYNLIQWFVPGSAFEGDAVTVNDKVELNVYPDASSVKIVTPDNNVVTIGPPFPVDSFRDTQLPGIYVVEQTVGENIVYSDFAVNLAITDGSALHNEYAFSQSEAALNNDFGGNIDLSNLFIILCIAVLALEWYVVSKGKFAIPDAVRSMLVIILVVSLFDINVKRYADYTTTVFAVDMSASTSQNKDLISGLIQQALADKPQNDYAGVVVFGEKAVIEAMPSSDIAYAQLNSGVRKDYTNIASGLFSSQSMIPENTKKKIILISDGNENLGDALSAAKTLKDKGIIVDVFPVEAKYLADAQISKINVDNQIGKDMNYNIEVVTYSLGYNTAKFNIYKNNVIIASTDIEMKDGENRYVFTDTADVGGNIVFRAEISPVNDSIYENNKAYAYSYVDDVPRVLVVSDNGSGQEIEKILAITSVEAESMSPFALPVQLEQLNLYDAIILANINYDDMPEEFSQALELYVKNGGGVIAVGGENSYALGGYYQTPLETLLPVDMELKSKEDLPDQSMIIVLDRSGSMSSGRYGVSKLELAKEAVIRSVEALSDNDYFGVLAFDTESSWAVNFEMVNGNSEKIMNNVASITEGGGTSILPSLEKAYETIKGPNTKLKHIILLTDGQDSETGYDNLLAKMQDEGITLSTVAVGSDSDVQLLEYLADTAGGRYYYTDEFTDLPKIFTKETFLAGKKYLNHDRFYPVAGVDGSILEGIESLPPLYGYISATAKTRADVLLYAVDEEPLLASWQYGIGRSVAFLSDLEGKWSGEFLAAEEGVMLFRNMLSWVMRQSIDTDVSVQANVLGDYTEIVLSIPYSQGVDGVEAVIITPQMEEVNAFFVQTAPGEYKANIAQTEEGAYIANINLAKEGGSENITAGISIPYSREYDMKQIQFGEDLLKKIANTTGGKVFTSAQDIFRPFDQSVYESNNLKPLLLVLAILLLLFDIAYHRFPGIKGYFAKITAPKKVKKNLNKAELDNEKNSYGYVNESISDKLTTKQRDKKGDDKSSADDSDKGKGEGTQKKRSTSDMLVKSKKKRTGR